jgi:hypothetical protein
LYGAALLDAACALIGAGIGIGRKRLGFEHDAGIEMDRRTRCGSRSLLADGDVTGKAAVEIFGRRFATRD